jgi:uncharacterized Fe-S radical SAM superfamily protein PflX
MEQYRPCYNACEMPGINRAVTRGEYLEALHLADAAGLHRRQDRGVPRRRLVRQ